MRAAAHHMVRFMTAGMALITCRETLLISINSNLKADFLTSLRVSLSGGREGVGGSGGGGSFMTAGMALITCRETLSCFSKRRVSCIITFK